MIVTLKRRWAALRESYWFLPSLMCAGAVALAVALTTVDVRGGLNLDGIPWLVTNQPAGARALLSTVAGSMITVAGVAFSVTLVALATAAGQYGPRLLTLFLSDRTVQASLGAFSATFLYCILVLRLVGGGAPDDNNVFVPQAAVLGAILLAVASLGVFIYFVHHMAQSINISTVVSRASNELRRSLALHLRETGVVIESQDFRGTEPQRRIDAVGRGYLNDPDVNRLVEIAAALGARIDLAKPTGSYLSDGQPLAWVNSDQPLEERVAEAVRKAVPLSATRATGSDPRHHIDALVQIAARALSPGVNDPFTAMTCIDALQGALAAEHTKEGPLRGWLDEEVVLRVTGPNLDFPTLVAMAFGQLRTYASSDLIAARHMAGAIGNLIAGTDDGRKIAHLEIELSALLEASEDRLPPSAELSSLLSKPSK